MAVAVMAQEGLPVQLACRVLEVSESGYYARRSRAPSPRAVRHAWLTDIIRQVHAVSRHTYGSRRVHADLRLGHDIAVGRQAVELLMRRAGVQGISGRPRLRRVAGVATAGDRVQRQFHRDRPNQLWVTDITEHRTREGKVYCAVVLDAWSRRVVGWSVDASPSAALVTNALGMANEQRRPSGNTIIHGDQGRNSRPGRSHDAPSIPDCRRRWALSAIASTTPSWNRSGAGCKSSSSTGSAGARAWSWPPPSSSTWRSSTTANVGTRRRVCSHPPGSKLVINRHQQRESKNTAPPKSGHP